jgi:hypothetical protein
MKPLFVLVAVTLCISCKKENISFPQDLYFTKITATSNLRLFINEIEVFDKSTIDNFTSQANIFNLQNQRIGPASKRTFLSRDTAVFASQAFKYSVGVSKNGNRFLFASPPYRTFFITVLVGIELYQRNITPFGVGYIVNEVMVGTGNLTNLDLSIFSYRLSRRDTRADSYQSSYANVTNQFNQDFIGTLAQTDTLAIREFKATFVAK